MAVPSSTKRVPGRSRCAAFGSSGASGGAFDCFGADRDRFGFFGAGAASPSFAGFGFGGARTRRAAGSGGGARRRIRTTFGTVSIWPSSS